MNKSTGILIATAVMAATIALSGCNKAPVTTAALPAASTGSPTTPTESPTPPPAADNVSDIDVTSHVKSALQQNDTLKGFDINVVTLKGDVRLIGVLNNQAQIDEAIKIARASEGAHTIHDELIIKK